jgi:hypothetical protein
LTAKRLLALLIDEDDIASGGGELGGRNQARQSGTDDDHIGVQPHG